MPSPADGVRAPLSARVGIARVGAIRCGYVTIEMSGVSGGAFRIPPGKGWWTAVVPPAVAWTPVSR